MNMLLTAIILCSGVYQTYVPEHNNIMLHGITWCCVDFSLGTICVSMLECEGCEGVRSGVMGGGERTPLPEAILASNETRRRFASCNSEIFIIRQTSILSINFEYVQLQVQYMPGT